MATAYPSSSTIVFKVTFTLNATPATMTIEDLIAGVYNTTYGLTLSNVLGLLKVTAPSGTIVHQNAGWAADVYSSPDIDGGVSWEKTGISLPLDDDSEVETGTYTFEYKLSFDNGSNTAYTVTKTIDYDYTQPTPDIEYSLSCRTSELTSTDATEYDITHDNSTITPTKTRTHTIVAPQGSSANDPGSTTDAERTIGGGGAAATDLWTGVWQTYLSVVLSYDLETWNSQTWFVVVDTMTGYDSLDVECDDGLCDLRVCLVNLITSWKDALGVDIVRAVTLETKVVKALGAYTNAVMAERCGETAASETYITELASILSSEDGSCSSSDDTSPQRIVAWADSVGGTTSTGPTITVGASDPTGGSAGDIHFQITDWELWQNVGGTWTNQGSFEGAAGSSGAGSFELLSNSLTSSALGASTAPAKLKTYTVTADKLAANGDYLKATAVLLLEQNTDVRTMYIDFGGDTVLEYKTASDVDSADAYVIMELWIERITASTQLVRGRVTRSGSNQGIAKEIVVSDAEDLTAAQDIDVYGQSDTANASTISCLQLKVEYFNV